MKLLVRLLIIFLVIGILLFLVFYFSASTNVSTYPLFTIDDEYIPSSDRTGAGMMKQGNGAGVNIVIGNIRVNTYGEVKNVATSTCYECFGVIFYSI